MQCDRVSYFIKRPSKASEGRSGRKSFAVIKRTRKVSGRTENETVESERIDSLNALLAARGMDYASVDAEVKKLCRELNAAARRSREGVWVSSSDNLRLLKQYWEGVYSLRKSKPEPAWNRLRLAIEDIGPHSLLESAKELQKVVDARNKGNPRRQRRIVAPLNQMRRWFGVREKLALEVNTNPVFKYLAEDEFLKVMAYVERPEIRALFGVLFYTGLRTGEAFAFPPNVHLNGQIMVTRQMLRSCELAETKTRKIRRSILIKEGAGDMAAWLAFPDKKSLRNENFDRILERACRKAFPGTEMKWVGPHDLRHSFAVKCLVDHGLTIEWIAKLLGNSVQVCETYYLAFVPEDKALADILAKTNRRA